MSNDNKPQSAAPPPPRAPAPPPKNQGAVTFEVDGKEVVAKPGTNMIDAAKTVGVEIPYYCYHPRLSIAANCRMCLVETGAGGKLIPACQTPIAEGMVIRTQTDRVRDQQRAVMEFLLLNHPVDCAICDQAGECKLQDYYMRYDHRPSRLTGAKVLKNKRKVLGPLVVLDQERCILCTRCVRFMNEVPQEPQLGVFGRGSHERIDVFPESGGLTSNYSGNVVDICPVGALLNREFRFRARAWFLSASPSVCTGCARGCSTYVDFMGQDTYRYRPRENEQINKSWMCDQGRMSYRQLNQDRLLHARLGSGANQAVTPNADVASAMADALQKHEGKVAVVVAPTFSNEDLMAALAFARDVLKVTSVYVSGKPEGEADHFLMMADKNPNRAGLTAIAEGYGLTLKSFADFTSAVQKNTYSLAFFVGGDTPVNGEALATLVSSLDHVAVVSTHESGLTRAAHTALPASSHVEDEGSYTQAQGITQRVRRAYPPKGDSQPVWKWVTDLGAHFGVQWPHRSSRDIFKALAPTVPALAQFPWDKAAPMNQHKPGITPLATGADGRPPGYREMGIPRVRGI